MPVTDMTRIDDAPKRIQELLRAGKSESTQYARFGHFLTNKLLPEDPTRNLINPLKAIFLIAGIVICVLCGSTQETKAALPTPSNPIATDAPFYDQYCQSAVFYYSTWLAMPNAYYEDNADAFWCYYLANYSADWYSFTQDVAGQMSDQKLSPTYFASKETAHDYFYNGYSEVGDAYYRIYNGERPASASAAP